MTARKHDYDALRADYERGEKLAAIVTRYRICRSHLQTLAAQRGWSRPLKTDLSELRKAYEEGVVLTRLAKQFRMRSGRISALAAENRWKRPDSTTEATHLAVQADYEGGVPVADIAAKHGYSPRTVQSLANTFGWYRKEPESKPRIDPMAEALRKAGYVMRVAGPTGPARAAAPMWVR